MGGNNLVTSVIVQVAGGNQAPHAAACDCLLEGHSRCAARLERIEGLERAALHGDDLSVAIAVEVAHGYFFPTQIRRLPGGWLKTSLGVGVLDDDAAAVVGRVVNHDDLGIGHDSACRFCGYRRQAGQRQHRHDGEQAPQLESDFVHWFLSPMNRKVFAFGLRTQRGIIT